jgi:hypothetical protein
MNFDKTKMNKSEYSRVVYWAIKDQIDRPPWVYIWDNIRLQINIQIYSQIGRPAVLRVWGLE